MNRAAVVCGRRLDYPAPDRAEPRYPVAQCVGARGCDLASCGNHLRRWADHIARRRLDAILAELDDEHDDDLAAAIAYLAEPEGADIAAAVAWLEQRDLGPGHWLPRDLEHAALHQLQMLRLVRRGVMHFPFNDRPLVTLTPYGQSLMRRARQARDTGAPALF